jgi:hypothetical protein
VIAHIETVMAIAVWLLACAAVVKWRGLRRSPIVLLGLAPLPLLAANDYGGEIVFRIYLFALPATAFLGAAVLWRSRGRPRVQAVVFPLALLAMLAGFMFGYYGKERMNYFSPDEVAASNYLFANAPRGSVIIGATSEYPGLFTEYEHYVNESWLGNLTPGEQVEVDADPVSSLVSLMRDSDGRPAYFLLTRSQEAEIELSGLVTPAALTQIEQIAGNVPELTVIYQNPDAAIMVLSQQPRAAASPDEVIRR